MKLYIYDHCPYCVKARMIFGFKKAPLELECFLNDDENTPKSMIGVKMVPILEVEKNKFMPESLDIIAYIDKHYGQNQEVSWQENKVLTNWIERSNPACYRLAMPRWVQAPLEEFKTSAAKNYFQTKKEAYIGSFETCFKDTKNLIQQMEKQLDELESFFTQKQSFFTNSLSVNDFHLFAMLRSLSIVKDLSFPEKVKYYSEKVAENASVPLHYNIAI